jgi:acyl-CoA thioester hydrolase
LRAPVAQFHIDYHRPLALDEEFTVTVSLVWSEGARLNTEYTVTREDGSIAATAYAIQMFTDAASGEACFTSPELLERCRRRWKAGEFHWLK